MVSLQRISQIFSKRTSLEKCLLPAVSLLLVSLVAVVIFFVLTRDKGCRSVCRTDTCHAIGTRILQSMDESVNPCENFYSFICGGWEKKHNIPEDLMQYGTTEVLRNKVVQDIRDLFTDGNSTGNYAIENVKRFYDSCLNEDAIEKRQVLPLLNLLQEFGGWPVADENWVADSYDALTAVADIQLRTSFGYIVLVMIVSDARNTSRNIVQINHPSLVLRQDILLNQTSPTSQQELRFYKDFFIKVARLVGSRSNNLEEEFQDILDIETAMEEMMVSDGRKTEQRMEIDELNSQAPETDWLWFLQRVTNSTLLKMGKKFVIKSKEEIIVGDLTYLKRISMYLSNKKRSRQIANYLGWRVILSRFAHLPKAFAEALREYSAVSGFTQKAPERWTTCVRATTGSFPDEVSHLYVKKYFTEEVKNEVTKIVLDLKFQFQTTLLENKWMDAKTRQAALTKLHKMELNIGYPYWLMDGDAVSRNYKEQDMPEMSDDIFVNDLALVLHTTREAILKLRRINSKQQWSMSPITVNAGYNRNLNGITIPAAFLQDPMYSPFAPSFYNYATIGAIIGHEITHGFDSEGRRRNGLGDMKNWWSQHSEEEFLRRTRCFVDQYAAFGLNGERTLAENIADNGGLRQAYMEFSRWKNKFPEALSLPGLERFTVEQQFFLSYGSIWCTKYREKAWNSTILYADHSPSPYRLKGTLSNLPQFRKAFGCGKNIPISNCSIW